MATADYWRQLDLVRPDELATPVTLVGAGGIGSPTALALVKMGVQKLTLYDPDTVEAHNLPNQLYRLRDIGRPKVEALAELLGEFAEARVKAVQEQVTNQRLDGIVISAVDSMASRQAIWKGAVRFRGTIPLYIDARMGAQVCRVFAIRPADPDDVRFYESTLFDDDVATEDPCTAQAIIYTVFGVSSLVANQVKRFAHGEPIDQDTIFDFVTLSLIGGATYGD
jgi:molybdopterin/thiamine biosynthesis adenylyltransferase